MQSIYHFNIYHYSLTKRLNRRFKKRKPGETTVFRSEQATPLGVEMLMWSPNDYVLEQINEVES